MLSFSNCSCRLNWIDQFWRYINPFSIEHSLIIYLKFKISITERQVTIKVAMMKLGPFLNMEFSVKEEHKLTIKWQLYPVLFFNFCSCPYLCFPLTCNRISHLAYFQNFFNCNPTFSTKDWQSTSNRLWQTEATLCNRGTQRCSVSQL